MRTALESKGISFDKTALTGADLDALIKLLYDNQDIMATSLDDLPGCDVLKLHISTGDHPPIRRRGFRHSPQDQAEISRQTTEMLKAGIIAESDSPWSAPVILCKKKDGSQRFVVDYRQLNSVTALSSFPLPTLPDVLDVVASQKPTLFTSLDLRSGYWQTTLDEQSCEKTAFQTHDGTFEFKRVPFGLCSAVQFFQMVMLKVLRGLHPDSVLVYLDDCLVLAQDPASMCDKLSKIFQRFRDAKLRLHPAKCVWATDRVKFLGHVFDSRGISPDPSKFSIIKNYPVCRTAKQVRSFLGLTGYYRRFVKGYSQLSAPLRRLLRADVPFVWDSYCQEAFDALKAALLSEPVLTLPDFSRTFRVTTDASIQGIAYILSQLDSQGREQVISYGGRGLRDNETRWGITELETLALIEAVREFHTYLVDREFQAVTDHVSITFLSKMRLSGNNRLARWALLLAPYKIKVIYKPGEKLTSADAISRLENLPPNDNSDPDEYLFCAASGPRTNIEFDLTDVDTAFIQSVAPWEPFDATQLQDQLERCPDFGPILRYLRDNVLPADDVAARKLLLDIDNYTLVAGELFHLYSPRTKGVQRSAAIIRQRCVPTELRPTVATSFHDHAHIGFDRLYNTIRSRFYWPRMHAFLREHVLSCFECQTAKHPVHPDQPPALSLPVPPPTVRWHLDFHGPFPVSDVNKRYILVLIDSTSMWPELVATDNLSAETAVSAIFDNIIARFGLPRGISLLTDNGSAFISKFTALFCKTFGIGQFFTTPSHPQTNSRAEQFANTIHTALRILCRNQHDWHKHLQSIAMAYRASCTANTQISPFETLFGKPMSLPVDWSFATDEATVTSPEQYASEILPKIETFHRIAMENAEASAARHRQRLNQHSQMPSYSPGDRVLLHDTRVKPGEASKLKAAYTGPFIITKCEPNFNYRLQHARTGKDLRRPIHLSRLRPLREHHNDYRLPRLMPKSLVATGVYHHCPWSVSVGEVYASPASMIVHPVDSSMSFLQDSRDRLLALGGEQLRTDCEAARRPLQTLNVGDTIITPAGGSLIAEHVMHVIIPSASDQVRNDWMTIYHNCFNQAVTSATKSLAFSFPLTEDYVGTDLWDISHTFARAIQQFLDSDQGPHLESIEFVTPNQQVADTLVVVLSNTLHSPVPPDAPEQTPDSPKNPDQTTNDSPPLPSVPTRDPTQWYQISGILKRQKRNGRDMFLVQWANSTDTSWVKRSDISPAALKDYYALRPNRRRRRKH